MENKSVTQQHIQVPPNCIEAEEAILGGIMLDPVAMTRLIDILEPADFYIESHRKIYQAALQLFELSKSTDLLMLTSYLTDIGMLNDIGGRNKLAQLIECTVSAVNIDYLAEIVREKRILRELIKVAHELEQLAHFNHPIQELQAGKIIDIIESKLLAVRELQPTPKSNTDISSCLMEVFTQIEKIYNGEITRGMATGFYDLDVIINGGLQRQNLYIIAGRPAMGKSAFAVGIANYIAQTYKQPTVFFSLEMSRFQLALRIMSMTSQVESSYLQNGLISEHHWQDMAKVFDVFQGVPLHLEDNSLISLSSIRSKLRQIQASGQELGLVVIDYVQLIEGADSDNRSIGLGKISRGLKQIAKEFNVPVIALSQLSRGVESRTNKRPLLSDLRESGALEQDADVVIMLYRDEYYNLDSPERGLAEVIIVKHRGGPTGTIKLLFDPSFTQFKNLARSSNG